MKYELNKKLSGLVPYKPISGDYKIRLDANESYFAADDRLLEEMKQKLGRIDFNRYPDPLCKNVCRLFAEYYGISEDYVTAGNGSDELINIIVGAFLEDGDKLLTFTPDFSMYALYGKILGHESVVIKKDDDLKIDVDEAVKAARENDVKIILFSNPCNPTSVGLGKKEVRKLINSVNALIVLDEAYMDFYGESLIDEVQNYSNVIMLRTASKAIGMAGIRLGFAVANSELTRALRAAKSPYNVNSVTQAIGEAVYSRPQLLKENTKKIIESKNSLQASLESIETECFERIYKSVTNFVFIKTRYAEKIYKELLNRSIAVRFMKDEYLRITAGSESENAAVISAIKEIVEGALI